MPKSDIETDAQKEERLRWNVGMKEILETQHRREVLYAMLEMHGLWERFEGLSDMTRDEAIGAHNVGVNMLNELRIREPELVALMINEGALREARHYERSSRDNDDQGRNRPRFVAVDTGRRAN